MKLVQHTVYIHISYSTLKMVYTIYYIIIYYILYAMCYILWTLSRVICFFQKEAHRPHRLAVSGRLASDGTPRPLGTVGLIGASCLGDSPYSMVIYIYIHIMYVYIYMYKCVCVYIYMYIYRGILYIYDVFWLIGAPLLGRSP